MLIGIILRRGLLLVESKKLHPGAGEREAKGLCESGKALQHALQRNESPYARRCLGPCCTAPESIEDTHEASSTVLHFPSPT